MLEVTAVDLAKGSLSQELVLGVVVRHCPLAYLPLQVLRPAPVVVLVVDIEDSLVFL